MPPPTTRHRGGSAWLAMLIAAVAAPAGTSRGAVIAVPADQPTIQAAIDVAADGDEIVVAAGTYVETISTAGKAVTIRSTDPDDPAVVAATAIDAAGAGSVITCDGGEDAATIIRGLTLRGGAATFGGGLACHGSAPTLDRCVITGNSATLFGGGVFADDGAPTLVACTVSDNVAASGGGVYLRDTGAELDDTTVSGNQATGSGAGVFIEGGAPTLRACRVRENVAGGAGGGLEIFGGADASLRACTVAANHAGSTGGGALIEGSTAVLVNCLVRDNTAISGGGLRHQRSTTAIANCTVVGNTAAGPGGIDAVGTGPLVTNSIVWSNSNPQVAAGLRGRVTFSLVEGGLAGQGNLDADPLLDDGGRPAAGSPVIDAGHNWAVPDGTDVDRDGAARFNGGDGRAPGCGTPVVVDMGAFERQDGEAFPVRRGDLDGDGDIGVLDLLAAILAWGPCPPDTCCLADLDRDGAVAVSDLITIVGAWGPGS